MPTLPGGLTSPVMSWNEWAETRKARLVKNEQAFRDYNDRRLAFEERAVAVSAERVPFVCECGDRQCIEALELTIDEFTEAHSTPERFTVKPGHVFPEVEQVVEKHPHFWVVEKDLERVSV